MKQSYLLSQDKEAALKKFNAIENAIPAYNKVNQELRLIGVNLNFEKTLNIINSNYSPYQKYSVDMNELIKDYLLDNMGEAKISGVTLKREALRNIIDVPDLARLKKAVMEAKSKVQETGLNESLVEIAEDGSITIATNTQETLIQEHSIYADNEMQITVYQNALKCANAMSEMLEIVHQRREFIESPINGIRYDRSLSMFVPDISYIKQNIR